MHAARGVPLGLPHPVRRVWGAFQRQPPGRMQSLAPFGGRHGQGQQWQGRLLAAGRRPSGRRAAARGRAAGLVTRLRAYGACTQPCAWQPQPQQWQQVVGASERVYWRGTARQHPPPSVRRPNLHLLPSTKCARRLRSENRSGHPSPVISSKLSSVRTPQGKWGAAQAADGAPRPPPRQQRAARAFSGCF